MKWTPMSIKWIILDLTRDLINEKCPENAAKISIKEVRDFIDEWMKEKCPLWKD